MADRGRPTEYKKEYITEVDVYLEECEDEYKLVSDYIETEGIKIKDSEISGVKSKEREKGILKVKLPTIEGFALRLGVSVKSLYNWQDEHPNFLQALSKIRAEQKKRLLNMGLSGEYNSTIAKLILSSNHGMTEKTDVTSGGKELTPLLVKFVNGKDS